MSEIRKIQVIPFSRDPVEILMLETVPRRGGFWQCITGKVEEGEENIEAAFREFTEETGVPKEDVLSVISDVYDFSYSKETGTFREFVYGFEIQRSAHIDLSKNVYLEHISFNWLAPREAMARAGFQSQVDSISHLLRHLGSEIRD